MRLRLVLAVGADDRKPFGEVAADDAPEQSERGPVRPLQVVEDEQQPVARDRGEPLLDGGCVERRVARHADGVGERLVRDERLLAARAVENRRPVGCDTRRHSAPRGASCRCRPLRRSAQPSPPRRARSAVAAVRARSRDRRRAPCRLERAVRGPEWPASRCAACPRGGASRPTGRCGSSAAGGYGARA